MSSMRPRARRALWALVAAPAATAWSAGGCTSPPAQSTPPDAQAVCPNTLEATMGAACTVEGLVCAPAYACGVAYGIARCVCTSGSFACSDLADAALEGDAAAPSCPPPSAPQRCPPTEAKANLATCSEVRFQCSYVAPCAGPPGLDVCECLPLSSGQPGFQFKCTSPCRYSPPPVDLDAGADDSSTDQAAHDAFMDSASSDADASLADGPTDARDE